MNIDERLEAITMNLELASRDIQDLREGIRELREGAQELREGAQELRGATSANATAIAQLRLEGTAQRERIDELVTSTVNLLAVSESHERRLHRMELRSA